MIRQSISITTPNDSWLNALIESEEYSSKSEIVNDLIRKARAEQEEMKMIRAKLIKAEQSGFIETAPDEMLKDFKIKVRKNGDL